MLRNRSASSRKSARRITRPTSSPCGSNTYAPSVVIDKGSCPGVVRDQRGYGLAATGLRIYDAPAVANNPAGDACDVGAVEVGPLVALAEPEILIEGFESGTLLFWDLDVP